MRNRTARNSCHSWSAIAIPELGRGDGARWSPWGWVGMGCAGRAAHCLDGGALDHGIAQCARHGGAPVVSMEEKSQLRFLADRNCRTLERAVVVGSGNRASAGKQVLVGSVLDSNFRSLGHVGSGGAVTDFQAPSAGSRRVAVDGMLAGIDYAYSMRGGRAAAMGDVLGNDHGGGNCGHLGMLNCSAILEAHFGVGLY